MNTDMITKVQTVARVLGYKTETEDAFGKKAVSLDGVRFMDFYAVKFDANDGFHGISLSGSNVIDKYLPDFKNPGTVKQAEVEMIAATVLKNTQHAGVLVGRHFQ